MYIGKSVNDDLRHSVIDLSISVRISVYDSVNDLVDMIRNNITL